VKDIEGGGVDLLVGIDIVDIERIKQAVNRTPRFLHRVFTSRELEYCFKKANPYPSLAVRFAAREAVRKLDQGFVRVPFHDTEIAIGEGGKPCMVMHNKALQRAGELGIKNLAVSLSHSKEQAIAVVVAEQE